MTAKEYLGQAYKIDRRINIILRKKENLWNTLVSLGSSLKNSNVKSSSPDHDSIGKTIAKVDEYGKKADALIDQLVDKKIEIDNAIQSVEDPVQREILERRYILFQTWESHFDKNTGEYIKGIADDMGYSMQHIFRLHGLALKNVKIPKDESK